MALELFLAAQLMTQRDLDFAKKYNLEIIPVVKPENADDNFDIKNEAYIGPGIIFNSKFLNNFKSSRKFNYQDN